MESRHCEGCTNNPVKARRTSWIFDKYLCKHGCTNLPKHIPREQAERYITRILKGRSKDAST